MNYAAKPGFCHEICKLFLGFQMLRSFLLNCYIYLH